MDLCATSSQFGFKRQTPPLLRLGLKLFLLQSSDRIRRPWTNPVMQPYPQTAEGLPMMHWGLLFSLPAHIINLCLSSLFTHSDLSRLLSLVPPCYSLPSSLSPMIDGCASLSLVFQEFSSCKKDLLPHPCKVLAPRGIVVLSNIVGSSWFNRKYF